MSRGGVLEIKIAFKNMDSSDAIKDYANKRAEKISKHLKTVVNCNYVFSVQKETGIAHLNVQAGNFHASAEATHEERNIYAAIDEVTDKLEHQARKFNEKNHDHKGNH